MLLGAVEPRFDRPKAVVVGGKWSKVDAARVDRYGSSTHRAIITLLLPIWEVRVEATRLEPNDWNTLRVYTGASTHWGTLG